MTDKTKSIESELNKLVRKLKKDKDAIEHFEEVEKNAIINAVESNNTDFLTPRERQLIYNAYNKIKQSIQKANEKFPMFKKIIIVIIAAIIVYLIWKILKKLIEKGSFDDDKEVSVYVIDKIHDDLSDTLGVDLNQSIYDY